MMIFYDDFWIYQNHHPENHDFDDDFLDDDLDDDFLMMIFFMTINFLDDHQKIVMMILMMIF